MMAERGLFIEHTTHHRGVQALCARIKRAVWTDVNRWHFDETYINVKGKWEYFYQGIAEDSNK